MKISLKGSPRICGYRVPFQQHRMLLGLMAVPILTHSKAAALLWPNPIMEPLNGRNLSQTLVAALRKILKGSGWRIETHFERGYSLERDL